MNTSQPEAHAEAYTQYTESVWKAEEATDAKVNAIWEDAQRRLKAFRKGGNEGYRKGGIVDYTGLAMVHGTTARPEAFLSAADT